MNEWSLSLSLSLSLVRSFVGSLVRWFVGSFVCSFVDCFVASFVHWFTLLLFVASCVRSLGRSSFIASFCVVSRRTDPSFTLSGR